jgi:hypothetical protein
MPLEPPVTSAILSLSFLLMMSSCGVMPGVPPDRHKREHHNAGEHFVDKSVDNE